MLFTNVTCLSTQFVRVVDGSHGIILSPVRRSICPGTTFRGRMQHDRQRSSKLVRDVMFLLLSYPPPPLSLLLGGKENEWAVCRDECECECECVLMERVCVCVYHLGRVLLLLFVVVAVCCCPRLMDLVVAFPHRLTPLHSDYVPYPHHITSLITIGTVPACSVPPIAL